MVAVTHNTTMSSTWKVRIVLLLGISVIIFGDLLGYGNANTDSSTKEDSPVQKRSVVLDSDGSDNQIDGKRAILIVRKKF